MTPTARDISPLLAQATDCLLHRAILALETAGADLGVENDAHHTLVMPGTHLREVLDALSQWNLVSCGQGACESWANPQAKAAQAAYQVVEGIFRQGENYRDLDDEAGLPMLVSGERLMALNDAKTEWGGAWKPPRRMGLS